MVANNLIYMFFHKKHRFDSFGQLILENINISTLEIEQKQRKSQKKKKKKMFLLQYLFILENFLGMLEIIEKLLLTILRAIVCKYVTEKATCHVL